MGVREVELYNLMMYGAWGTGLYVWESLEISYTNLEHSLPDTGASKPGDVYVSAMTCYKG
jgi:hypothetical protein